MLRVVLHFRQLILPMASSSCCCEDSHRVLRCVASFQTITYRLQVTKIEKRHDLWVYINFKLKEGYILWCMHPLSSWLTLLFPLIVHADRVSLQLNADIMIQSMMMIECTWSLSHSSALMMYHGLAGWIKDKHWTVRLNSTKIGSSSFIIWYYLAITWL